MYRIIICTAVLTVAALDALEPAPRLQDLLDNGRAVSAKLLTANEWRIHSPIFPKQPANGYPIDFSEAGLVEASGLAGVQEWAISARGDLLLLGSTGAELYEFEYDECQDGLVEILKPAGAPPGGVAIVIRLRRQTPMSEACQCSRVSAPFCCEPCADQSNNTNGEVVPAAAEQSTQGHLHMVERASENWRVTLLFRDLLRSDPDSAREYAEAKVELAAKYSSDRPSYQQEKDRVVERLLERAASRRPAR
ncbi:MAG: GrpB family protein [bacterium]|nr:GrpB family protein [bacterium]